MEKKEGNPITTITGLLVAMGCEFGSKKVDATLFCPRMSSARIYVEKYFDSGPFRSEQCAVDPGLFERARREGLVSEKSGSGYGSNGEFKITHKGQLACDRRIELANRVLEVFSESMVVRSHDISSLVHETEETVVADILDFFVSKECLEVLEEAGERLYRRIKRRLVA